MTFYKIYAKIKLRSHFCKALRHTFTMAPMEPLTEEKEMTDKVMKAKAELFNRVRLFVCVVLALACAVLFVWVVITKQGFKTVEKRPGPTVEVRTTV